MLGLKEISAYMKSKKHAITRCQEHATPAGGNRKATLANQKPESEAKTPVLLSTQQHCNRRFRKSSPWQGFSKCPVSVT